MEEKDLLLRFPEATGQDVVSPARVSSVCGGGLLSGARGVLLPRLGPGGVGWAQATLPGLLPL